MAKGGRDGPKPWSNKTSERTAACREGGGNNKKGSKVNMPRFTYNKNKRISSSSIGPLPPMVETNKVTTCIFRA